MESIMPKSAYTNLRRLIYTLDMEDQKRIAELKQEIKQRSEQAGPLGPIAVMLLAMEEAFDD